LPSQWPFFSHAFINPNGNIYIIHSPADYSDATTLTLLDEAGAFVNDITLHGEYVFDVSANQAGLMLTLSRQENNYVIKLWNENLNSTELKILPEPAYFHHFTINGDHYYEIRLSTTAHSFSISRFDLDNHVQWTRPLGSFGISGFTAPLFFPETDDFLLVRNNSAYDSLVIARGSGSTGNTKWLKKFSLAELGAVNYLPKTIPLKDGSVMIFSKFRYRKLSHQGLTLSSGILGNTQNVNESFISHCFLEQDGGYLIASSFAQEEGWHGFRLLKTDSRFNVGWVGNFYQSVPGYLISVKQKDDTRIYLTSNGYVYAIKPVR
ncbi:MAG: hypothetical protein N2044_12040, partial [Cyclobacteriaceae bacterium]|nr:hypothetical protein [Cyclobacteriaceae bacterium]